MRSDVIKVMVVDDEQTVLDTVKVKLEMRTDHRFEVSTHRSGERILEIIELIRPDVVLIDNWIGQADEGLKTILPAIKGAFPDQKVIVFTSRRGGDTDQILEARAWGAYTLIDKQGMWNNDLMVEKIVAACGLKKGR